MRGKKLIPKHFFCRIKKDKRKKIVRRHKFTITIKKRYFGNMAKKIFFFALFLCWFAPCRIGQQLTLISYILLFFLRDEVLKPRH